MDKKQWVFNRAKELRGNQTEFEKIFAEWVEKNYLNRPCKQYPIEVNGKYYILDFFFKSANIAVEIDGKQHIKNREYDKIRDNDLLSKKGIYTIRIDNCFCSEETLSERFDKKFAHAQQVLRKKGIPSKKLKPKPKKGLKKNDIKTTSFNGFNGISLNYWF